MLPPNYFYWFRVDNKHLIEPWLDQALMDSAYRRVRVVFCIFYSLLQFLYAKLWFECKTCQDEYWIGCIKGVSRVYSQLYSWTFNISTLHGLRDCGLHLQSTMSDSQRYPLNLRLIKYYENMFVVLSKKLQRRKVPLILFKYICCCLVYIFII